MNIKFPKTLEHCEIFISEPFCIFENKNFLDKFLFEELEKNFPTENIFQGKHGNGKIYLNEKHEEFFKFIKNNIWGSFYEKFNSERNCLILVKLIQAELKKINNRKKLKKFYFVRKLPVNFVTKIKTKFFKMLNYHPIRMGFEFSIIKQKCFIPPHCDAKNKLLSLMIYFPDNTVGDHNNMLGTNFYSKKKNSFNSNINSETKFLKKEQIGTFYSNYEVFHKSKFEKNKLVGFIRNDRSWHDVPEFNFNISRKSLNINLYLE